MRTVALFAGITLALLCVVAAQRNAQAQTTLGAPTSLTVTTTTTNSLTLTWVAPVDDGGTAITSYDLRVVETALNDGTDQAWTLIEGVWTAGTLEYLLPDLRDGVQYDLQMRADNGADGPWSTTTMATTSDHGGTQSGATTFTLGSTVNGAINQAGDIDYFKIDIAQSTDVWLYTSGDLDTHFRLEDSSSTLLTSNDNAYLPHGPLNSSVRRQLEVGTYFLSVRSNNSTATGTYVLHGQAVTDPGETLATATTITIDVLAAGRIGPTGGAAGDHDYFKLELSASTDLWVQTFGDIDTYGELLDFQGTSLANDDDSAFLSYPSSFMLRRQLGSGTYYIKVRGADSGDLGPYTLHAEAASNPGTSESAATPLLFHRPKAGRLSSTTDIDHFSITVDEPTWVRIYGLPIGSEFSFTATVHQDAGLNDRLGDDRDFQVLNHSGWDADSQQRLAFWIRGKLNPGTSYVKVKPHAGGQGGYAIHLQPDELPSDIQDCLNRTTSQSDPLYGCQWHMNNTNQFGSNPGFDINVESAWETTKGEGINIMVNDDGLHYRHDDIRPNYNSSFSVNWFAPDIYTADLGHGTAVTGIIAARDDETGIRGVAPRANVSMSNIGYDGLVSHWEVDGAFSSYASDIAVYNNSWGVAADVQGGLVFASALGRWSLENSLRRGFNGKGSVFVMSGGNDDLDGEYANLDEYLNHYGVIAVCAVTYYDIRSFNSERGPNLWICAPGGISAAANITTINNQHRYRTNFAGTSAAAPIVSGVAALVRSANTDLTWRDVKLILAASARQNHPSHSGWTTGALKYGSTSERYHFSHSYGFGMVDAGAAVALATDWTNLPGMRTDEHSWTGSEDIPDGNSMITKTFEFGSYVEFIEYIAITVDLDHPNVRNLRIELESPSGAISVLTESRNLNLGPIESLYLQIDEEFRLGSARHLGENPEGVWKLHVRDERSGNQGTLDGVEIIMYGHGFGPSEPRDMRVTVVNNAFRICWSAPAERGESEITSYDLRYFTTSWQLVESIATNANACYDLTGVTAGIRYQIQLRAVNSQSVGSWNPPATVSIPIVPGIPTNVTVVQRNLALSLTWDAPLDDGGGDIASYDVRHIASDTTDKADDQWSTATPAVSVSGVGPFTYTVSNLANGTQYDLQVRASNSAGAGAWTATVLGTPNVANHDPEFATETAERSIEERSHHEARIGARLRATDPDSDRLYYTFAPPADDWFDINERNGQLEVGQTLNYEGRKRYVFTVRVSDRKNIDGDADREIDDTIEVTVLITDKNESPDIDGLHIVTTSVAENFTGVLFNFNATDPDADDFEGVGGGLEWWVGKQFEGNNVDWQEFNADIDGKLRFNSPPDFENPLDHNTNNSYYAQIRVTDGEYYDALEFLVRVTRVNEPPEISGPANIFFEENANGTIGNYRGDDPEGEPVTLRLAGPDRSKFELADGGDLTFITPPDFDARADANRDNNYQVRVIANDLLLESRLDVTVTVTDVDESPVIVGPTAIEMDEHVTGMSWNFTATDPEMQQLILSLNGFDSGDFMFVNGVLRFAQVPDFEAAADANGNNVYEITVTASDGEKTASHPLTIRVLNVDELGSLTLSSEQPLVGTALGATLTDPDEMLAVQSWTWEQSANRSTWTSIAFETSASYEPTDGTVGQYLRVTANYNDGHGAGKVLSRTSSQPVAPMPIMNTAPVFPDVEIERSVRENSSAGIRVGSAVTATDAEQDTLSYTLTSGATSVFTVHSGSGQLRVGPNASLDYEDRQSYSVTITATDPSRASSNKTVSIAVENIDEPPIANGDSADTDEDVEVIIDVLGNDRDPEGGMLTVTSVGRPGKGVAVLGTDPDYLVTYQPALNHDGVDEFTYTVSDDNRSTTAVVSVTIRPINDPPTFATLQTTRSVSEQAEDGADVGARVTASDVDGDVLSYRVSGSSEFAIVRETGQIVLADGANLDAETQSEHLVTVYAADTDSAEASIEVKIIVTAGRGTGVSVGGGGGGGGGGPPPVPVPSDKDFEWNVTRDIESLHRDNDLPTGIWSDGLTLWVVENSATGSDLLFAYDLVTGERVTELEFELDRRNRFSHGIWSDNETVWIADSGQDRLFAYVLATGERLEDRDLELAEDNRDPRDIWSNGDSIYVLDSVKDALFVYDLKSGELLAQYSLDKLNRSPRGIWSDGVTIWVSDDGAKRIFAYEVDDGALVRHEDQEFTFRSLLKAGNGDARGIWSDGDIVFVADEQDDHVYTYNLPDAIVAQLASLSLSDVQIDEFSPGRVSYTAQANAVTTVTTVEAIATQEAAIVVIAPADADGDTENGHQVALGEETQITITVSSVDGSRARSYQVIVEKPRCLDGLTNGHLSDVRFIGGSVDELGRCAGQHGVVAFFYWTGESWLLYAPDAPAFLNRPFRDSFINGVPAGATLIAAAAATHSTEN